MVEITDPCRILAWDSSHFGVTIAVVNKCDTPEIEIILRYCLQNGVQCLYFFSDFDMLKSGIISQVGFDLMDVKLTFSIFLAEELFVKFDDNVNLRAAVSGDRYLMDKEAVIGFRHSRFYRDIRFDRGRVEALYELWWSKSLTGELAQVVWIAEVKGAPVAYATASIYPEKREAEIGLVGVSPLVRGRGVGQLVVSGLLQELYRLGVRSVKVSTQVSNIGAIRLYEKIGFCLSESCLVYHAWFPSVSR